MKFTLTQPKPRNPWVVLVRLRAAGKHQPTGGSRRQTATRQLRSELQQCSPPKQSP